MADGALSTINGTRALLSSSLGRGSSWTRTDGADSGRLQQSLTEDDGTAVQVRATDRIGFFRNGSRYPCAEWRVLMREPIC